MNNIFVFDDTPVSKQEIDEQHKKHAELCRQLREEMLEKYKEILKPAFYKKLLAFLAEEDNKRLNNDRYGPNGKYISINDAIYKLIK